jgi:dCTP deaminase
MPLLTDSKLRDELRANPNIIHGLDTTDWSHLASNIQPCSVDLHIGDIYLPGESTPSLPGSLMPRNELTLATGQTAVLVTKERLNMPRNWAAYGFPPSHVSAGGLLMTNPGHIDPGYVGKLGFTVINMSAEGVALRQGDAIVTLIIHQLDSAVEHDFAERRTAAGLGPLADPAWNDVNRLAKDFVDVEARSKKIASNEIRDAQDRLNKLDTRTKFTTAIIGAAAAVVGIIGTVLVGWLTGMQGVKNDVNDLKSKVEVVELKKDVADLASRISDLEKTSRGSQKK